MISVKRVKRPAAGGLPLFEAKLKKQEKNRFGF